MVITVVGILAAMVIPAAGAVMRQVRALQATHTATELRKAIATYATEYRRYPVRGDGKADADVEITSTETLMDVLLAAEGETGEGGLNQRKRVFFSGRKASDGERPRSGIKYQSGGGGILYDPWGNHFRVILDTNRDERCEDPSKPGETIAQEVLVWSCGPDGVDNRGDGDDRAVW